MLVLQLFFDGISIGCLYALIALAMVIIYKASEVPNFAQGNMGMISTFAAYYLMEKHGFNFPLSVVGALIFSVLLAVFFEFVFLRRAKEPNILNLILITIGFDQILYGVAGWKFGAEQKLYPSSFDPLPLQRDAVFNVGGVALGHVGIIVIVVSSVLIISLFLFFKYTNLGIAMKATQQNQLAARINGIRTNRIMSVTWALSSMVGAIAAMLLVPGTATGVDANLMMAPLLKGFAAAVLGGMTSLIGSIGGGIILGIIEKFFGFYVSSEFEVVVSFAIIILILWFRPSGLFGKHFVRKV